MFYSNVSYELCLNDSLILSTFFIAGYNYIIFESEKQVKALLQACTHDYSNGGNWYFKISSRRMRSKEVI